MGVLNFDDESGDSNIPLGTNLCRVASGLPLFYETYLVNHFTNISDEPFISRNNYSRIGYTLADPKINKISKINKINNISKASYWHRSRV